MRIAILTNFQEFNPGYSLTGIVRDQIEMLERNGHDVTLIVSEQYNMDGDVPQVEGFRPVMPFAHLVDYKSVQDISNEHYGTAVKTADMIEKELKNIDIAFTHDLVFTGWNMPYALGIWEGAKRVPNVRWLHWVHSVPSGFRDWWDIEKYGPNHKLIFPNSVDSLAVAEQYRGTLEDIRVIPHIKDPRTWFDFDAPTKDFINRYPKLLSADVVQILPASVDRLSAKRLDMVIRIFASIKSLGRSVCLIVANQWATARQHKESCENYRELAKDLGLDINREFAFTSDFQSPTYEVGIPKRMLRELFLLSNLFVFPTVEESFGLVVPEAILSGGVLPVLNRSLHMQMEISGFNALYFDFGSYRTQHNVDNVTNYCTDIAKIILGRMKQDESIRAKTFVRKTYNMDHLYDEFYGPILAESHIWGQSVAKEVKGFLQSTAKKE